MVIVVFGMPNEWHRALSDNDNLSWSEEKYFRVLAQTTARQDQEL
jgi:hypothetical protein